MIHQYKNNGYNIVLDVNSGSVHVVDDIVYDIITLYEKKSLDDIITELENRYPENEVKEAYSEIEQLKEAGQLFSEDIYSQYGIFVDVESGAILAQRIFMRIT